MDPHRVPRATNAQGPSVSCQRPRLGSDARLRLCDRVSLGELGDCFSAGARKYLCQRADTARLVGQRTVRFELPCQVGASQTRPALVSSRENPALIISEGQPWKTDHFDVVIRGDDPCPVSVHGLISVLAGLVLDVQ